uniref:UBX domain-containing protein n=1 Tax=Caenorhabditis tropicalis TaxID=1561998 RepID=A0A1I7TVJ9_9PELO
MYVDIRQEMLNGASDLGAVGTEIEQCIIDSIQLVLDTEQDTEPKRVVQESTEPELVSEEKEEWDPCVKMNGETVNYTEFLDKDGRPFVVSRLPNGGFFSLDANRFRNELDACGVRYNIAQNQELLEEHFEFPTPRGLTEEEETLCKQIEKIRLAEEKKKKEEEAKILEMAEKKREKNRKKREKQKDKKKREV